MTPTEIWGPELYGDPCRQCGFEWSISTEEAIGIVAGFSTRFTELLVENVGTLRHPELTWSAAAYVSHVADNLWIWAQRLSGARLSGVLEVPGYDQDLLAQARNYNEISTGAAIWALGTAAELWQESVNAAGRACRAEPRHRGSDDHSRRHSCGIPRWQPSRVGCGTHRGLLEGLALGLATSLGAISLGQQHLANAHICRSDLHAFVFTAELERLLE